MSELKVSWTKQFKKDYKAAIKRKQNIELLDEVIRILAKDETLGIKYKDNSLSGNWKSYRECHITPRLVVDLQNR